MTPAELEAIRATPPVSRLAAGQDVRATAPALNRMLDQRDALLALVDEQALALRRAAGLARIIDGHLLDLAHIVDPESAAAR